MKKLLYLLMSLVLLAACGSDKTASISSDTSGGIGNVKISAQSILSQAAKGNYKEGELLVKFKAGVVTASSQQVHKAAGSSVVRKYDIVPNLELVTLPKGMSVQEAIQNYMSDPNVEYAEPNYIRRLTAIPNDIYFRNQWALHNDGTYAGGTSGADMKAPAAWDITTGHGDIVIAVLDTGVDYSHPDLVGNLWRNTGELNCFDVQDNDGNGYRDDCYGWNFVDGNNDPIDDLGHGTHVAGSIGARSNNGTGIAGVMWQVKIMPLKICDSEGVCDTSDELAALKYLLLMKNRGVNIKVINASFGGEDFSYSERGAIADLNAAGILFIASAGNGGQDGIGDNNDVTPHYPSGYDLPNIISVAATDQDDRRVPFSNYGLNTVHVAAPGVYTFSTVPSWWSSYPGYGYLDFYDGTSMAAPHVAGLAGLLFSYYDGVNNTVFNCWQVRDTIRRYVDRKPTLEGWIQSGGRINAYRALSSILTPTNLSAKATSSKVSLTWTDNATGEDGYVVERSTGGGPYSEIAYLPHNTSSFDDWSVTGNTSYSYRVKAYNNIAASFYSNTESVTVPRKSGGSGGCSIGGQQSTLTAFTNAAVLLAPVIVIAVLRRRR